MHTRNRSEGLTETVSFRVTIEDAEALDRLAAEFGISRGEVCRAFIRPVRELWISEKIARRLVDGARPAR